MKRFGLSISKILLVVLSACCINSCSEEESDYELTVVVLANDSVRVANAMVHLHTPEENSYIDWYDWTNEEGEVSYSFPNKVIVDITATKGSFKGCSFAEVNPGQNTKRVEIKPFGSEDNGCSNAP